MVAESPVLPIGTYLVEAAALVNVSNDMPGFTTYTIGTTGTGDSVLGNEGSVEDPSKDYGSSGDAVLNDTVKLTQSNDQIELSCGSDVDYSMTEQVIGTLVMN